MTARVLGRNAGILTSWGEEIPTLELEDVQIMNAGKEPSTTFENLSTPMGRKQRIHNQAGEISLHNIPQEWETAQIIHLGPVADEIDLAGVKSLENVLICTTPQGWMRDWNEDGWVKKKVWQPSSELAGSLDVVVVSSEDLDHDESSVSRLAEQFPVLAVTESKDGSRVYWNGDVKRFSAPQVTKIDSTGAGDIFAASFFIRYQETKDPWEAGRFANCLAANSVSRSGLQAVPLPNEIQACFQEVL
jgi:sugar/nucleoside kinase (ribokinase family)